MKVRMIVATLVFALAAWVPAPAQQSSVPQSFTQEAPSAAENSGRTASKAECACCSQVKDQAKDSGSSKMTCCQSKSMDCRNKDGGSASGCCAGKKHCAKNGKSCCGKNMTACNKEGKGCCAGGSGCCSHNSQS